MTTPSPRTPVRPGRGTLTNLAAALQAGDIKEGEIVYAKDQDRLYVVEDGFFVPVDGGISVIDDLTDVDTSTTPPTDGQVLAWNSTVSEWRPASAASGGATTIDDLTDVDTSTSAPTDGQVLTWSGVDSEWRPADATGGSPVGGGEGGGRGDGGDFNAGTVDSTFVLGVYGGGDFTTGAADLPSELLGGNEGPDGGVF